MHVAKLRKDDIEQSKWLVQSFVSKKKREAAAAALTRFSSSAIRFGVYDRKDGDLIGLILVDKNAEITDIISEYDLGKVVSALTRRISPNVSAAQVRSGSAENVAKNDDTEAATAPTEQSSVIEHEADSPSSAGGDNTNGFRNETEEQSLGKHHLTDFPFIEEEHDEEADYDGSDWFDDEQRTSIPALPKSQNSPKFEEQIPDIYWGEDNTAEIDDGYGEYNGDGAYNGYGQESYESHEANAEIDSRYGYRSNRRRDKGAKRFLVIVLCVLAAFVLVGGLSFLILGNTPIHSMLFGEDTVSADNQQASRWQIAEGDTASITIEQGDTASDVVPKLYEAGLSTAAEIFIDELSKMGSEDRIIAGTYTFLGREEPSEIARRISNGQFAPSSYLGIDNGDTLRTIAAKITTDKFRFTGESFLEAAQISQWRGQYAMLDAASESVETVEGLIPAGTYDLMQAPDAVSAMALLLDEGERRYEESGMTPEQWWGTITVASMIEKEVIFDDEKPMVASVIENRLRADMPLQIDATILYALGRDGGEVTYEDLEVDSPYNTYKNYGLVPGPICSGISDSSLDAVRNPAQTDYLYYVLIDAAGHHSFSEDYDSFMTDKASYVGVDETAA